MVVSEERSALETGFPSALINLVAEQESWRKEINRPTYHMHKWWANRLGSVFRAILIAALSPDGTDVAERFYEPVRFPGAVVLDPMMGSGTTVGEALKLGCTVVGQDINPVAYLQVLSAVTPCDVGALERAYNHLSSTVGPQIGALYRISHPEQAGSSVQTLYSFLVTRVACPDCGRSVQLFDSYIFARHAYLARNPTVHSVCPCCGGISAHDFHLRTVRCSECGDRYSPAEGPAQGAYATCSSGHRFKILTAVGPERLPEHDLYASLVLTEDGRKMYIGARSGDDAGVARATALLAETGVRVPQETIEPGHNTDQLRSYGYRYWHQLFTPRQLYGLSLLARAVADVEDTAVRSLLALLVSSTVEFNNLLCSYKGEGTGAVRPAFSHHILKPERMPLENTVWGTPESSGCFTTLYRSRLLRALSYRQRPFELHVRRDISGNSTAEKVYGLAARMSVRVGKRWQDLESGAAKALIMCGDARQLPLPDGFVDAVITDPPYFDFVHYSELADLFHGWLRLMLPNAHPSMSLQTTRQPGEIQQRDPIAFASALTAVLSESARVLKPTGVLAFSFHHSRDQGWAALGSAILDAGLGVVAAHLVKAEMSVAAPKAAASEAIDIDAILVCKRREPASVAMLEDIVQEAAAAAAAAARTYQAGTARSLSRGDLRVILQSQCLVLVSRHHGQIHHAGRHVTLAEAILAVGALLDSLATQLEEDRVSA